MIFRPFTLLFSLKVHFSMGKGSLSGNTINLRLFSIKECDAIRPGFELFYFADNFGRIAHLALNVVVATVLSPT